MVIVILVAAVAALVTFTFHHSTTQAEPPIASGPGEAPASSAAQPGPPIPASPSDASGNEIVKADAAPAPKTKSVTAADARLTPRRTHPKTVAVDFSSCREIATVHFTANSSELAPDEVAHLRDSFDHAGELSGKLEIAAYCDDIGAANWNVILSQRRANAVAKAITSIQPDLQLETKGLGSNNPAVPNSTWKARAQNRRAEVRVCPTNAPK